MYPVRRKRSPHAAKLRRDRTPPEDRFWAVVRNRQIDGLKFRFQASIEPFVADFLCVELKLIVELDGGQHSDSVDLGRTRALEVRGYRVLRFWNNDVLENLEGVIERVRAVALEQRATKKKTLTQPSPAKAGEG